MAETHDFKEYISGDNPLMYHIRCKKGDVGEYVFLPGDPFRTDIIASYLDDAKLVAHNREHKTWTGYLDGVKVCNRSIHFYWCVADTCIPCCRK